MAHYLDHNSATPTDPRVLERFLQVERDFPANPASLHASGRGARGVVQRAREAIAQLFQCTPQEVLFTSGGTEANNQVVLGAGNLARPVLLARVEHPSALAAAQERGCIFWSVDDRGVTRVTRPDQDVGLVCLAHGQNEVGSLQPVVEATVLAKDLDVPLHVDASQTLGRCSLRTVIEHADTITLSTHKAGGLRGCAVLIARAGALKPSLKPLLLGGGQQHGLRPGTESSSLIAATALTVQLAWDEREARGAAMLRARQAFLEQLPESVTVLTPLDDSLPNTLMCLFTGVDGRLLLPALDVAGIEASRGSACSSGSPTPPVVLEAMGLTQDDAQRCVRFSFSHHDEPRECTIAGKIVREVISRLIGSS